MWPQETCQRSPQKPGGGCLCACFASGRNSSGPPTEPSGPIPSSMCGWPPWKPPLPRTTRAEVGSLSQDLSCQKVVNQPLTQVSSTASETSAGQRCALGKVLCLAPLVLTKLRAEGNAFGYLQSFERSINRRHVYTKQRHLTRTRRYSRGRTTCLSARRCHLRAYPVNETNLIEISRKVGLLVGIACVRVGAV